MKANKNHIYWIDIARGFAILFVMLGHCKFVPKTLKAILYGFHIPLFFSLSGYVLNYEKYENKFFLFLKSKFKTILLPYFTLSFVLFIWVYIVRNPTNFLDTNLLKPIIGILLCRRMTTEYFSMWFLPCLFFALLLSYFCIYLSKNKNSCLILIIFILAIFSCQIANYTTTGWLFCLDTVPMATLFILVGYLLKKNWSSIENFFTIKWAFISMPIAIISSVLIFKYFGMPDLFSQKLQNIPLYFISAFFGIWATFTICIFLKKNCIVEFIGKNSIIYYAYHNALIFPFVYKIVGTISSKIPFLQNRYSKFCLIIIISLIIIAIISEIFNKSFPFLLGRSHLNDKTS